MLSSRRHLERLVVTANHVATSLQWSPDVMPACGVAGAGRALRSYRPVHVDLPRRNLFQSSCLCLKDLFCLQKEGLQEESPCMRTQCHEPYFSLSHCHSHSAPNTPFRPSNQLLSFDLTSICVPTIETVRTSLIMQPPVTAHPVGSLWSPHQEGSKITMHICTLTAQNIIPQLTEALIDPMT